MPKRKEKIFKKGKKQTVLITIEVEVTPETDCDHEGLANYAVGPILALEDLESAMVSIEVKS